MFNIIGIFLVVVMATLAVDNSTFANAQTTPDIRLVLQITVDGLRADLLNRYGDSFGKDGFRFLMEKGTVYTNAHYQHANTETIVGHATLVTGAFPSQHGMIGNIWFDREAGELAYNIEDPDYPLLPSREESNEGEQVDPAQKLARTKGRSPAVLLAPTISDGLAAYYGGRSKVFGVSGKDRSAVAMAGQTGKAFWFSTDNGDFITSSYYYDDYPDYFSVSFSSTDVINHFFGPSSLENEEIIRQLDHTLADLIKFIDKTVGLKHTLIVLSSDHGMADMPEYMTGLGYTAGRLIPEEIVATANKVGKQLGIDEVVRFFYRPYIYLDDEKIAIAKLDHAQVEQAIANTLTDSDGIELAVSTKSLATQKGNPLLEKVRHNQHVTRSGDIYIIQKPYWFLFDEGPIPSMHGSPWRYDTHVPIVFAGPGIDAQTVHRLVHPVDVAPTIAAALGMTPPASAQGSPLEEVLR